MNEFRLASPWWLLLAVPLLAATLASIRFQRRGAVLYSSERLLDELPVTWAQRVRRWLPWLHFSGLLLVLVAVARPQAGLQEFRVRTEGIAIMMCLDRSGSMEALDFELDDQHVNRLTAVKRVFRDFVAGRGRLPGRPDDLIGLIAFGGFAESKVPLTLDHGLLLQVLDSVEIAQPLLDQRGNIVNERYFQEERATAIGDAVALAVERLKAATAKSKVVILLSDGENTAGVVEPESAADAAKEFGIKIYSIGVGSTGRVPFPHVDRFGRKVFIAQDVRLDEATLKMLAEKSNGKYYNAQDTRALEQVYADIDQLEKTVSEGTTYTEYRELFQWWLVPGIAVILLGLVLRCTRFRAMY
jgi:Ca-activated chloride channel family protein